ncbi:MAG: ribosome-binding factor A [Alphaproteobacteria bacterium]
MADFVRPTTGRTTRQLKAAELVKGKLADMFSRGDFRNPALYGKSFTISDVLITPDMRFATVYIWPLAQNFDEEAILEALEKEAPRLNKAVAQILTSRSTPRLTFKLETLFDDAEYVENLFNHPKVRQDIEKPD